MKWSADRHDATTAHEARQTHCYVHHLSNYTMFVQSSAEQRLGYSLHITAVVVRLSGGTEGLSLLQCSDRVRDTQPHNQWVKQESFTRGKAARA